MPTLEYRPQIFVFGSNLKGIHGAGSALFALKYHKAQFGNGSGPQGDSYALATCATPGGQDFRLEDVKREVNKFIEHAKEFHWKDFKVTQIGCLRAGFTKEEIAPLFLDAPANCYFDTEWKPFLGPNRGYWGTYP